MKTYLVTITKNVTAEVEVQASSEEVAERRACKMALEGRAEFHADYDALDVVEVERID